MSCVRLFMRLVRRARYARDRLHIVLSETRARYRGLAIDKRSGATVKKVPLHEQRYQRLFEQCPGFVAEESPLVSIVIPVFNHLDQTQRCLHAIAQAEADVDAARFPFEIIVVDDGSSDDTAAWIERCSNVRLHRMPSNSGFVEACNTGAILAKGQFLLFLNNDTEVRPGWLSAMMGTFDEVPDCGLVGAKLVYPNGTLQEAGGIVFSDGHACNYGRYGDPDSPAYDFMREVDYCSGACILLRTTLFFAAGGFDRRYTPAYYEDTDLAFSVRALGYKVIYQPRAVVMHFEGGTAGSNPALGIKQHQITNRSKFQEKHAQALTGQPSQDDYARSPEKCAVHRCTQIALIIDADFPCPDRDSGSVRMLNLLKLMRAMGCHVMFWPLHASQRNGYSLALEQLGVEIILQPSRRQALTWWYAHGDMLDLVLMSRVAVAHASIRAAYRYARQARRIFDTVDLHFLRVARGAELHADLQQSIWANTLRAIELNLVRHADMTLVVSTYERSILRDAVPGADVRVLSNIHRVAGRRSPFESRSDLLFLGNFDHEPNVDAAQWLLEEVMPRLLTRLPEATLHIVGQGSAAKLGRPGTANVQIHDYVADLNPLLSQVKLALAPLRFGAGVKGKINTAMAHGIPVVTTSIGAEGMWLVERHDVMIADDADGFVDAIVELYQDSELWMRLSDNGLENVQQHFSEETARAVLEDILAV